jgi:hypothetical protein
MAVRLKAVEQRRPILVVASAGEADARLLLYPAGLDVVYGGMNYYLCRHKVGVCIPSVAYDPSTVVLYYNGTNHYCCTWLHNPSCCGASTAKQMLSTFRAVAEVSPGYLVVDMQQERLLSDNA